MSLSLHCGPLILFVKMWPVCYYHDKGSRQSCLVVRIKTQTSFVLIVSVIALQCSLVSILVSLEYEATEHGNPSALWLVTLHEELWVCCSPGNDTSGKVLAVIFQRRSTCHLYLPKLNQQLLLLNGFSVSTSEVWLHCVKTISCSCNQPFTAPLSIQPDSRLIAILDLRLLSRDEEEFLNYGG